MKELLALDSPKYIRRLVREGNKVSRTHGLYFASQRLSGLTTYTTNIYHEQVGVFGLWCIPFLSTRRDAFILYPPYPLKDGYGREVVASREE